MAVSGGVTEAVHVLVERRGQGVPVVSLGQRVGTSGQEQTHHLIVPWERAHTHSGFIRCENESLE